MKPYIELLLSGEKTIECRLTRQARPPFDAIREGERIYFKQSAGPYALTAVADHVLFEEGLTPGRVRELKRDYNEFIRGDGQFWQWKREARYATLIWLREIEPIDAGPAIRPLQGLAWLSIDGAQQKHERDNVHHGGQAIATPPARTFSIEITDGNLRNRSLYVSKVIEHFPKWCIGGANRREAARAIVLLLRDGPRIETDIVGPRKLFRTRQWGDWYETHEAKPGDQVVFTPIDDQTFFVGLKKVKRREGSRRR